MSLESHAIDLNADIGEGFPWDAPLLSRVTSASICCGAHAGDPATILETLRFANAAGVAVGAHPGFPDRDHFGRRERNCSAIEARDLVLAQVEDLSRLAARAGSVIRFVKPHGALYNQAQRDPDIADGIVAALQWLDLPLVGMPGAVLEERALGAGVRYLKEGFPERGYRTNGSLIPRGEPGAEVDYPHEVVSRAIALACRGLATLCLHGDAPRAVEWADLIREGLTNARIGVRFWGELPPPGETPSRS